MLEVEPTSLNGGEGLVSWWLGVVAGEWRWRSGGEGGGGGGLNKLKRGSGGFHAAPFSTSREGSPPVLGGLNRLKRGSGRFHAAPFSTSREGYPPRCWGGG